MIGKVIALSAATVGAVKVSKGSDGPGVGCIDQGPDCLKVKVCQLVKPEDEH
eukprot:gene904-408_t